MMNKFNLLMYLILFDILLTIFAVKYMNAIELYPLFPFTFTFNVFMYIKIGVSVLVISFIYLLRHDKYINMYTIPSIILYIGVGISNIWQTVNYLYY
jgi:multisubunit Na+/H+ antiporter MnhB subunit